MTTGAPSLTTTTESSPPATASTQAPAWPANSSSSTVRGTNSTICGSASRRQGLSGPESLISAGVEPAVEQVDASGVPVRGDPGDGRAEAPGGRRQQRLQLRGRQLA